MGQVPDKNQCKDQITGEPKVQNPTRTENEDDDKKSSFGGASKLIFIFLNEEDELETVVDMTNPVEADDYMLGPRTIFMNAIQNNPVTGSPGKVTTLRKIIG